MQNMLPPEIFDSIVRSKGVEGWSIVEPADVFEYILGDEFGTITTKELSKAKNKVKRPWNKSISLKSNLEAMKETNERLGAIFPHMKLNDQIMFQIAYEIALNPFYDLVATVNNFMNSGHQTPTTSLFPEYT